MLFAAGLPATTAIVVVATLFPLVGILVYAKAFVKKNDFQAQLDKKDAVITIYKQTVEGFESRVEDLEYQLQHVIDSAEASEALNKQLKEKLTEELKRYRELKRYTAPEAVEELKRLVQEQTETLHSRDYFFSQIITDLKEIKKTLGTSDVGKTPQ